MRIADERGVILNWIVRLILLLAIGGVILFDVGSIVVNFFTLDSTAQEVATQLSTDVSSGELNSFNSRQLELAARATDLRGAKLVKISVNQESILELTIRRKATTLVVSRIGFIEDWAKATADARADTN